MRDYRNGRDHDQTLNDFYRRISEKIHIEPHLLVPVTHDILGSLVRRLHYTSAAKLTSLLPKTLQEEFLDMPAGPDRSITVGTMIDGLVHRHNLKEPTARATVLNFFSALEEMLPTEEIKTIKMQLPEEFRALFVGLAKPTHPFRGPRETGNVA